MENQIGRKIRYLRKRANVTLEMLARETGFTKGYLSKIERGLQIPPIATLSKIANALHAEMADFFEKKSREVKCSIVHKNERKPIIRDGSIFGYCYESIAYKKHHKMMNAFVITLIPNAKDQTMFTHEGEELMFVLKGTMEFWFGEERYIVKAGDCIYFDSEVPHRGQCIGNREAKVLVVIYSPKNRIE